MGLLVAHLQRLTWCGLHLLGHYTLMLVRSVSKLESFRIRRLRATTTIGAFYQAPFLSLLVLNKLAHVDAILLAVLLKQLQIRFLEVQGSSFAAV
jgi:hypothetical protein